jgi:hypothetical protein
MKQHQRPSETNKPAGDFSRRACPVIVRCLCGAANIAARALPSKITRLKIRLNQSGDVTSRAFIDGAAARRTAKSVLPARENDRSRVKDARPQPFTARTRKPDIGGDRCRAISCVSPPIPPLQRKGLIDDQYTEAHRRTRPA